MSNQIRLSEDRDRFRRELGTFRANVLRGLPAALGECESDCAARVTAEVERRLDEAIAAAEAKFMESLHHQVDGGEAGI